MRPKERVLTAFSHQQPDRVPLDYLANPGIDARLKAHFNLAPNDAEGLRRALGVDFRGVAAPYIGPKLHENIGDVRVDMWGIHRRWVEHAAGGYWDFCDFPLQNATLDEIEAWPMPSPDDFDYCAVPAACRRVQDYCVVVGGPGVADVINSAGMIRGMEQTLIDLVTDDPAGMHYIERRFKVQFEIMQRTLEAANGAADLFWMGEDLGTQIGPMISLDLYRRRLRPIHQRYVDLARAWDLPVMFHCCGSSSWAFDEFIEMGVAVVDTLQPEAKDMAPAFLKQRYGTRLAFHGCISTAGPVAQGNVDDTVRAVRETLEIMMPDGGYALSPTHALQDNSPTENVVAMYRTAREFGTY
ncbi:MAG: hypothetical protein GXP31_14690 [Kiritimatiellaeota bacterium]|nr:hypothetical protein [Kiritimatiellota bacterium]